MNLETGMTHEQEASRVGFDSSRKSSGPRALKAAICEETARLCVEQFGDCLRAIILTGSLARDEATFLEEKKGGWRLLGDAEFFMLFEKRTMLPSTSVLDSLRDRIEISLSRRGVRGPIDLSAVHPLYLRKLPPCVFTYELRTCGQVVWGDSSVLSLVSEFSPSDIPLEDAWRLLSNRIVEELEVAEELNRSSAVLPQVVRYRVVKLYLDMATSLLLFVGAYKPSYQERVAQLALLAGNDDLQDSAPLPLRRLSEKVATCTRLKLDPSKGDPETEACQGVSFYLEAVSDAHALWRWELARLTGRGQRLSDRALLELWSRRQPLTARLRGWLYVLRARGWVRSWRNWLRWGSLGLRASPRYLVYAAGCELFFRLPSLVAEGLDRKPDCKDLESLLPEIRRPGKRPLLDWHQLASEVAWNYHQFLEKTRT